MLFLFLNHDLLYQWAGFETDMNEEEDVEEEGEGDDDTE